MLRMNEVRLQDKTLNDYVIGSRKEAVWLGEDHMYPKAKLKQ